MFVMKSVSAMFLLTFVIIFDNETIYLYIIEIINKYNFAKIN
jgi:hypothetical protein